MQRAVVYLDEFVVRIAVTPDAPPGPVVTVLMSREEYQHGYQAFLAGVPVKDALPTLNKRYQQRLQHGRD